MWCVSGLEGVPSSTGERDSKGLAFSRCGKAVRFDKLTVACAEPRRDRPPRDGKREGGSKPCCHVSGSRPSIPTRPFGLGFRSPTRFQPRPRGFNQAPNSRESSSPSVKRFGAGLPSRPQSVILSSATAGDRRWSSTSICRSEEADGGWWAGAFFRLLMKDQEDLPCPTLPQP